MDIANNGNFFIGTRKGYSYYSNNNKIQENMKEEISSRSVSISEDGNTVVLGTTEKIIIIDQYGIVSEENTNNQPISHTAINSNGDIAVAATTDKLYLYRKSTDSWKNISIISTPIGLNITEEGSTVVCGMSSNQVWILNSRLDLLERYSTPKGLYSIDLSADGKYFACGLRNGKVIFLDTLKNEKWRKSLNYNVKTIKISNNGSYIFVLTNKVVIFDIFGDIVAEIPYSNNFKDLKSSKFGNILLCSTENELNFYNLKKENFICSNEFSYPSSKSIPLDDPLISEWSYGSFPQNIIVADVNGDTKNEILCSFEDEIKVLNSEGHILWNKSFPFRPGISIMDITSDFIPEIIVKSNNNLMELYFFDGNGNKLSHHEFYFRWYAERPGEKWGIGIEPLWSGDIDGDGLIEIICNLYAGYVLEPRGLYAFEYPSFKEEWYYPTAPHLTTFNFVDLNGDGEIEIITGSEAPWNGRRVQDTDDFHAYVYAINLEGNEIWKKEIGEGYKRVRVAVVDLEGDGDYEIIGAGWSNDNTWGSLFVLDRDGKYISEKNLVFTYSIYLQGISDLDGDGDMEIVIASSPSNLSIYDSKLKEIRGEDIGITMNYRTNSVINDIDGNGEKEIAIGSDDTKIVLLNRFLEEIWSQEYNDHKEKIKVFIVNLQRCKNQILILSDKLYSYSYSHNPDFPCIPWIISKENKFLEIENYLEDTNNSIASEDYEKAGEFLTLAKDICSDIGGEEGLEYYSERITEIEELLIKLKPSLEEPESPEQTKPQEIPKTPEPDKESEENKISLQEIAAYITIIGFIISLLIFIYQEKFKEKKSFKKNFGKEKNQKNTELLNEISNYKENKINHSIRLFLSYSSKDKNFVENLAKKLASDGFQVWYDKWEIKVGESITSKIKKGILSSDFLLLVLSNNSINSEWVKKELEEAYKILNSKKAFILPVLLEECKIPSILSDKKYANFKENPELAYKELLDAIYYHYTPINK